VQLVTPRDIIPHSTSGHIGNFWRTPYKYRLRAPGYILRKPKLT